MNKQAQTGSRSDLERRLKDIDDVVLHIAKQWQMPINDADIYPRQAAPLITSVADAIDFWGLPEGVDLASLLSNLLHAVHSMRSPRQTAKSQKLREQKERRLHLVVNELRRQYIRACKAESELAGRENRDPRAVVMRLGPHAVPKGTEEPAVIYALARRLEDKAKMELDAAMKWLQENKEAKALIARYRRLRLSTETMAHIRGNSSTRLSSGES